MTTPMTIAYLTNYYARVSHRFIHREVAHLRALGHTVSTFSVREPDPQELTVGEARREFESTEHILPVGFLRLGLAWLRAAVRSPGHVWDMARLAYRVGIPGLRGRVWSLAYQAEAAFLAERLRALGVEHLHCHFGDQPATVAMLTSALSGIPYSLTIHGPAEFDRPTLLAFDEKVHRSAFTAAVSEYGRSQLYRWTAFGDWPKIHVVHCGLDDVFLERPHVPVPEARRLVCVGRLAEQKGQLLLVEAAARLAAEGLDFEVVLVGDGPMRPEIERLVARHGLRGQVRLAGWLDSEGVRGEILRSRAMVLPSFAEGLPVVLMEALALGRPVISTYVAGIPELVIPGDCGWLVPAGAVGPLVDAMRSALTAPPVELDRMGRAGAERAARRHDGAVEARKLADLIARGHAPAEDVSEEAARASAPALR
jgi:glycosyltransferase involved in cell wall biosynthesis